MKHSNISIFVPHNGCKEQCSFCNQKTITGVKTQPTPTDVRRAVMRAGQNLSCAQIAFFGGSFTAIDRQYMLSLLAAGKALVEEFSLSGIRISTRPDKIDAEILEILKLHHVTAIELGAQSMDDEVLAVNLRGHMQAQVCEAAALIKKSGFELGLQMMTGLYMDTKERTIETARAIIALRPDTVRIYPTITLEGTYLEKLYKEGKYKAQELDEAVDLCAKLIPMFERENIRVIRVGLHAEDGIEQHMVAGPYHPAFKELCISKIMYDEINERLAAMGIEKVEKNGKISYNVKISAKMLSAAVGQHKSNVKKFSQRGINIHFIPSTSLQGREFEIEKVEG